MPLRPLQALCFADMIRQHIAPSARRADMPEYAQPLRQAAAGLEEAAHAVGHAESPAEAAALARVLRLETMVAARALADEVEGNVPADLWTLATYKELLFQDCLDNGGWARRAAPPPPVRRR